MHGKQRRAETTSQHRRRWRGLGSFLLLLFFIMRARRWALEGRLCTGRGRHTSELKPGCRDNPRGISAVLR
ncbi:hypothetical protein K438DRAFT_297931 [Mycena galopus ATCC 62051]|nr:hypothetical protein K438DRAFT_297931 [Mycena galopus ATCC 62051]